MFPPVTGPVAWRTCRSGGARRLALGTAGLVLLLSAGILPSACDPGSGDRDLASAGREPIAGGLSGAARPDVRPIRVRLFGSITRLRARSDLAIHCRPDPSDAPASTNARPSVPPLTPGEWHEFTLAPNGALLLDSAAVPVGPLTIGSESATLEVSSWDGNAWRVPGLYPGPLRIVPDGASLLVIGEVDLEPYVAGVVAAECLPTFHREMFRAQAVAARTYALYHMLRRDRAEYDLSAGEGAQVFRGLGSVTPRISEAVSSTRGVVGTCERSDGPHVFCSYYHASCGGVATTPAPAPPEGDVPPLRGGVRCRYCSIAPTTVHAWGPVRLPMAEVLDRLRPALPALERWERLADVEVAERAPGGRARVLRLRGPDGASLEMDAERWRIALGAHVVRSTAFDVRVRGGELSLDDGRGFGHGMGLCQWGAEGLARRGWRAGRILRLYYPGIHFVRAY